MTNNPGKNWLLLRGLARESAHWGSFIQTLKTTFPDAKITTLDLPGTGNFYREVSPYNIKAITDATRQQALNKGLLQQPITLLAVSLGAMVAWEWMHTYPNDICGASLINTSFANLSPFYHRLRWQSYPKFSALLSKSNILEREKSILQLVSNRRDQDNQISLEWAQIQNQRPINLQNFFRQIIAAASYRPNYSKPKQPILLINAMGDRLVNPVCSEKIQEKYQLTISRHPWGGHDLTLDDPEWIALQLKEWLFEE